MGASCCSLFRRCPCCCKKGYEKSSEQRDVRVAKGLKPGQVGDECVRERFAVPEGSYSVILPGEKTVVINSSAFLPTGDVVLADSANNKLKLYNCNFQLLSCIEFPAPVQHVCCSPNLPLLYASFPDRVRQIHVDGSQLKRSGFIKTPGTCRGVCINRYDGKAISMTTEEDVGQVNLLTPGGNLQLEIDEDDNGNPIFIQPEQIAVTRDLNILVLDKGQNCVIGISPQGEPLFHYTGIRVPTAVVCDEKNYIYVAGPQLIHQLNESGELVKLFLSRAEIGLSPLSLSYNQEKKLLLATGKNAKVKLFKMVD